ncbi:MAG TPA: addiction module antidote protein, HigA family [Spirochaetes bacterium]|nr:addiction module antidote protein, HigA family [Spirochaetota bacterium]
MINTHPGQILVKEFLDPPNISEKRLAEELKLSYESIQSITKGKSPITANIALRLSRFFGNTPQFWLNLQSTYDLRETIEEIDDELSLIVEYEKQKSNP